MRVLANVLVACATLTTASAVARADFTLTWHEHLHSSRGTDKTIETTVTVTEKTVHWVMTYAGPEPDKPRNKPQDVTGVLKDPKGVAAALAKLDKVPVTPTLPPGDSKIDDRPAA